MSYEWSVFLSLRAAQIATCASTHRNELANTCSIFWYTYRDGRRRPPSLAGRLEGSHCPSSSCSYYRAPCSLRRRAFWFFSLARVVQGLGSIHGNSRPGRRLSLSLGSHTRQTGGLMPLLSPSIPVSSARATPSIVPLPPSAPATHEVSPQDSLRSVSTSPSLRLRAKRSITSSSTSLLPSALRA